MILIIDLFAIIGPIVVLGEVTAWWRYRRQRKDIARTIERAMGQDTPDELQERFHEERRPSPQRKSRQQRNPQLRSHQASKSMNPTT